MTDKARILFVDDEKRVLNAMRGLFRREYELFLTCDGAEAIRIASENEIDVIVADQRMPGMTGIEVLAEIKEKSPRTVRILLTGYADPSAVEGSINIGEVFRFLSKPCPPKMLRETLSLAINASHTKPITPTAALPTAQAASAPGPAAAATTPTAAQQVPRPAPQSAIPQAASLQPTTPQVTSQPAPQVLREPATQPPPMAQAAAPPIRDFDETHPALPTLDESATATTGEHSSSHWQSVTNVIMSEDTVEETQENVALSSSTLGMKDIGVVVFTVDSEFAATAIRAVSAERTTVLATTLVKVAQAIEQQSAGVLVTDFTTNNAILQKIIGALKQHMPQLVTIVVSSGRDTNDMINLINYGQVFRYVLKPIEPEQLRSDINAAVIRHLYLLNNPDSAMRHQV
ncbi:MAG: response regulator, partial [Gammaproteobacteria bacterium]|nr:response regulator [Gammaproteobacteria bacterium]